MGNNVRARRRINYRLLTALKPGRVLQIVKDGAVKGGKLFGTLNLSIRRRANRTAALAARTLKLITIFAPCIIKKDSGRGGAALYPS